MVMLLIPAMANSNEAVQDPSLSLIGTYIDEKREWFDRDFSYDRYSVDGKLTSPIPNTKYLGMGLDASYNHEKVEYGSIKSISIDRSLEAKLFLRDWQTGGILLGHKYLEEDNVSKVRVPGFYERYSNSAYFNTSKVKAEYYFDQITVAARYSYEGQSPYCCDRYDTGLALSFYPTDHHIIKISERQYSEKPTSEGNKIYYYRVGFESQPQYFLGKVKLRGDYEWDNLSRVNFGSVGVDYQFADKTWMNSAPTIGVSYTQGRGEFLDTRILGFSLGFQFDNRISLKDRDRKYLFNSEL